jgi:hypothetical protein
MRHDRDVIAAETGDVAASSRPPTPSNPAPTAFDIAWVGAIAVAKASVLGLAIDAFLNSDSPRFSGKGMRLRAIGYAGGLLVVPVAWRLRGRRSPYPRELDLAMTLPLLIDAGANAIGIYQRAHVDDLVHFANGALLASVVGALATPRARTSWEAAGVAAAVSGAFGGLWEIGEWIGLKAGARGMDLSYDDTMTDLIETMAGGGLGAIVTLLRHPSRLRDVPGRRGDTVVELQGDGERPTARTAPRKATTEA